MTPSYEQIRRVQIIHDVPELPSALSFPYTTYEEVDGVWKVQEETVYVNELSIGGPPEDASVTRWKRVGPVENVAEIRVFDYVGETLLESHEL